MILDPNFNKQNPNKILNSVKLKEKFINKKEY